MNNNNKPIEQTKDQYPLYCLSFSPNWNTYQILSTNPSGLLVYGTNAEAFIIDMQNKNFISSIKPPEEASYNQIKVTSVLLEEDALFVGYLNGIICAYDYKKDNQLIFKTQVSKSPIMHIIKRPNTQGTARLLLADSEGAFFELVFIQEVAKVFSLTINCFSQVIKCHEFFASSIQKSLLLTINSKGIITIWDLDAKKELFNYNGNNAVYKADFIFEDENTITCGLITKKEFLVLLRLDLKAILGENKEIPQFQAFPVKLHFQLQSKDKGDSEVLASKPDIMFLGNNRLLMSGKTGELFLIPVKSLETKQELKLRHLSAQTEEEETSFQVVERNPHYKQIYSMGKYIQKNNQVILYTLGIDRKLSFWKYEDFEEEAEITPMWNINYLGGKVRKIVTSELEKNKIFFSCIDKTLRVWDLEKKNNKFSTQEIWKQVSHTQIFNLSMHPSFEGLCAYSTEDSKICMYDISSQVCFKVLKIEREVRSLQWIHKDLYRYFVNFAEVKDANFPSVDIPKETVEIAQDKEEGEEAKVNIKYGFLKTSDAKFTKTVPEDYMLLVTLKNNHLMLLGMTEKIEFYNTELLVNQDSFSFILMDSGTDLEKELLVATGSKDGKCTFYKVSKTKVEQLCAFKYHNYHISAIRFNRINNETILCATSSHDRKIMVYEISLNFGGNHIETKISSRLMFKHKNKVDNIKWSTKTNLLAISTQDRTVQVWNCLIMEEDRKNTKELTEPTQNREICNIRGHDGFITDATFSLYDEDIVITASDDQTIKVWDIKKIIHKTLANPKKKNKQKNKKQKHKPASLEDQEPNVEKKIKSEQNSSGDHNLVSSPQEEGLIEDDE